TPVDVHTIDEYVHTDLEYLSLLRRRRVGRTLVALVGVQSHQFHRALDLAVYARRNGCMAVIGGPHAMTCDTSPLHGRGVSFALAEAELVWPEILADAAGGELRPVYGRERRWQQEIEAPVVVPPSRKDLGRYVIPMLGLYPARGCPFVCNFCSVIKIAGRRIRSQTIGTTLASLRAAKAAGVRAIMFTSDNFNKYPEAEALLSAMVDERLGMELFVQCDTQIARQEHLVALLARAGCFQMFVGVESFNRQTLLAAHKGQNRPETYREIVRLCREHGIGSHFSNIIGFPQDTERQIDEHLESLRGIGPNWASFYVLCPIPGTEQYDDFMAQGLITEKNLDRLDTTCLTWQHPCLSREQLGRLLFGCYRQFFSLRHALENVKQLSSGKSRIVAESARDMAMSLFVRYCAWRRTHPMSGGVMRVRLDKAADFIPLRQKWFGFELAPLPRSLQLPAAENLLNRGRPTALAGQPAAHGEQ
ncbi:MAG: radical SAM protein, partial [Pirellulales bacterium]